MLHLVGFISLKRMMHRTTNIKLSVRLSHEYKWLIFLNTGVINTRIQLYHRNDKHLNKLWYDRVRYLFGNLKNVQCDGQKIFFIMSEHQNSTSGITILKILFFNIRIFANYKVNNSFSPVYVNPLEICT